MNVYSKQPITLINLDYQVVLCSTCGSINFNTLIHQEKKKYVIFNYKTISYREQKEEDKPTDVRKKEITVTTPPSGKLMFGILAY